jgi:hypothetical protein
MTSLRYDYDYDYDGHSQTAGPSNSSGAPKGLV